MIKNYFKQAWASACHNKVSTVLYLSGVALAVTTVMIISIVFHTKLSPIYPETNRDRMAYMESCSYKREKSNGQWGFPWQLLEPFFGNLENAEAVAIRYEKEQSNPISRQGANKELEIATQWVNDGFFEVFSYDFLAGSPLTAAEVASGAKVAILDRPTAEALFGSVEEAIDQTVICKSMPLRVKGVVRESSRLTPKSHANAFMPYSLLDGYDKEKDMDAYKVEILMKKGSGMNQLKEEFEARYAAWNQTRAKIDDLQYVLNGVPKSHYVYTFNPWSTWNEQPDYDGLSKYAMIALVLLLVPALNLSGLVSGNIRSRSGEIGIRKSFGASRTRLLGELLAENFILTLGGALIGLLFAWILVYAFRDWVFNFTDLFQQEYTDTAIQTDMLLSPVVFLIAVAAALVLNTVSSLIPAWQSLRRDIVDSLNRKL